MFCFLEGLCHSRDSRRSSSHETSKQVPLCLQDEGGFVARRRGGIGGIQPGRWPGPTPRAQVEAGAGAVLSRVVQAAAVTSQGDIQGFSVAFPQPRAQQEHWSCRHCSRLSAGS